MKKETAQILGAQMKACLMKYEAQMISCQLLPADPTVLYSEEEPDSMLLRRGMREEVVLSGKLL